MIIKNLLLMLYILLIASTGIVWRWGDWTR